MTHLELENLTSDYLEGLLEPALKREVDAHLSVCPSCLEMVGDVRRAMELCHSAPELDPAPWLIRKIMLATVGERKPTLAEHLVAFFRPALQLRFAYGVAMAVFSFSIIVNAAGVNLRHMTIEDLNPRTSSGRIAPGTCSSLGRKSSTTTSRWSSRLSLDSGNSARTRRKNSKKRPSKNRPREGPRTARHLLCPRWHQIRPGLWMWQTAPRFCRMKSYRTP